MEENDEHEQLPHIPPIPRAAGFAQKTPSEDPQTGLATADRCTTRNLIITAAHCVFGTGKGTGITVAPGYDAGSTPYGVWSVTDVFMDSAWKSSQSDPDDVAFLRVAPRVVNGATRELQDVTGANTLGDTPASATTVTVQGFNTGTGDRAISCTTGLDFTRDNNPTFGCAGYVGGSSGSPWLVTGADGTTLITGVIGGLNQGGCNSRTSYSPVFGTAVGNLLARAEDTDAIGDTTPPAGTPSGCTGSSST